MSTWISQLKYLRKFRSNIFQLKWDTTTNEKWWFHFKKQSTYTQVLTIYGWKMTTCITQDQKSRERHPADDKSHVFIVCHHSAFFGDWYFYSQWCCWDQSKTWHSTHQKLYFFTPFLQSGIPNILHHKPSLHMDCARALWDMLELHRAISQITCWSFILKMGLNPSTSTRPRKIHFHIWNSGGKSLKWACRWVCVRERDENELVKKFG